MESDFNKRRAQRQKQIKRKRMKIALVLFLIFAFIALIIMCFTVFFPVKKISISGSEIYSKEQLIKASGLTTDDNIFAISEDKIEEQMRKKLPYIDDVNLKRKFPNAVILTVTDAKERSYFEKDGKYYIVSANGYVLIEKEEAPDNLFHIITSGVNGVVGDLVKYENTNEQELIESIIKLLDKYEITINKIDISNAYEISICVEDRFVVNLGSDEFKEEKIAHLSGMIKSIGDRSGNINLSMWTPQNSQGSFVENK